MNNPKAEESVRHIRATTSASPVLGIILGSGLGRLVNKVSPRVTLPYLSIPNFPVTTVKGHKGNLVLGSISGVQVALMEGRFHFYEGRTMAEVAFPVEVLFGLGATALLVTNAAGGIRDDLGPGDLMLVSDHINLMGSNPLLGRAEGFSERDRFVDMTAAYDPALSDAAVRATGRVGVGLKKGVLAALPGPCYETPSEIRWLKAIGADAVCMSTVPEVIMARYLGMKALGLSLITNKAAGLSGTGLRHDEVLETAAASEAEFAALVEGFVGEALESGLLQGK